MNYIIKYIKWLLDPPVNITGSVPKGTKCEFCNNDDHLTYYSNEDFCICHECLAKSHRSNLTNKNEWIESDVVPICGENDLFLCMCSDERLYIGRYNQYGWHQGYGADIIRNVMKYKKIIL